MYFTIFIGFEYCNKSLVYILYSHRQDVCEVGFSSPWSSSVNPQWTALYENSTYILFYLISNYNSHLVLSPHLQPHVHGLIISVTWYQRVKTIQCWKHALSPLLIVYKQSQVTRIIVAWSGCAVDFNSWHEPSQAFTKKHVSYPRLTAT